MFFLLTGTAIYLYAIKILIGKWVSKMKNMSEITDLTIYRNKAYLELCLTMVEEAYKECGKGNFDMTTELLGDILETFDVESIHTESMDAKRNILSFPTITT